MKISKLKIILLACVGIFSFIAIVLYVNQHLYKTKASGAGIPTFKVRARVTSLQGNAPDTQTFRFVFNHTIGEDLSGPATATGTTWSDWITFGPTQIDAFYKAYPVPPMLAYLEVNGATDPTKIEVEVKFDENGQSVNLSADLFDKYLGILIERDSQGSPLAYTMSSYNQRYVEQFQKVAIPENDRPKQFVIGDGLVGDNEAATWQSMGLALKNVGINTLSLTGSLTPKKEILSQIGIERIGAFNVAGHSSVLGFGPRNGGTQSDDPATLDAWAKNILASYTKYGYSASQIARLPLRDEGIYQFPQVIDYLKADSASLERFRVYLQNQGLSPEDVGSSNWSSVQPIGREVQTGILPQKRLFYWTSRFMAWEASRYLSHETEAIERNIGSNINVMHNTHVWTGRLYSAGPNAGFPAGDWSPTSAGGMWDWFEHARMRGTNMMYTEDWFKDSYAPNWSYFAERLSDAANKNNLKTGGYVVLYHAGDTANGLLKKAMALAGHGAKEIFYYVFGPAYNIPADGYSEQAMKNPHLFGEIAQANQMIGRTEDLLYPGKTPKSQVAILFPRSSFMWDRYSGSESTLLFSQNWGMYYDMDYAGEIMGIFRALQNSAIQPEFIEEDDLTSASLSRYKVLYVTEPNIPLDEQQAISKWVNDGGVLVKVTNAGTADRYNESTSVLSTLGGVLETPRERLNTGTEPYAPVVGTVTDTTGKTAEAVKIRGTVTQSTGIVEARFNDNTPAIVNTPVGSGKLIHYAFLPGYSYWNSGSNKDKNALTPGPAPTDFNDTLRQWIIKPIQQAGVKPLVEVSRTLIEAPVLESAGGAAITLLNWIDSPAGNVTVRYRSPFNVARVNSAKQGDISFAQTADGITFTDNLDAVDVIRVYSSGSQPNPTPTPIPPTSTPTQTPTPGGGGTNPTPTNTPSQTPSDTIPPTAPSNLRTTSTSSTSVTLAWNAATDNSSGAIKYYIQRNGVSNPIAVSSTTFTDSGLSPDTSYIYMVYAIDAAYNPGPASNFINVRTSKSSDVSPPPNSTSLSLNLLLHGLGIGGDSSNPESGGNNNPKRLQRKIKVEIYNSQNQLVQTKEGTVSFDSVSGSFKGNIDLGSSFSTGVYSVKVKSDQYLKTLVPGIQSLTQGQTNTLPQATLATGDMNNDNRIDILDFNLLYDCYSDLTPAKNCSDPAKKQSADITDDGDVNQFDYNLFLRELTNIRGE